MWHLILIGIHAAAGVLSFACGVTAIRRGTLFPVHLWSLVATIVFLALPVALGWNQLDSVSRILFVALLALGGFMIWRAVMAGRQLPFDAAPTAAYVRHVSFNLVALFDAFMVIVVLDLGAPIWLVVATGIVIAMAGRFVREAIERRIVPATTPGDRTDTPVS